MKREILIMLTTISLILIMMFCAAGIFRSQWNEIVINEAYLNPLPLMSATEFTPKDDIPTVDKLASSCGVIVLVEGMDTHIQFEYGILSACSIKEVYKGGKEYLLNMEDVIYIHEPFVVADGFCVSDSGYMLMQKESLYILFLNFYEQPEGYRYSDIDKRTFLISSIPWGKVAVQWQDTPTYVPEIDSGIYKNYKDLKGYLIISASQNEVSKYEKLCADVLKKYNAKEK